MAGAFSAFGEAFSAYAKNLWACLTYSLLFGLACSIVFAVLAAISFVFGALSLGSILGVFTGASQFSVSFVILGGAMTVLLLGVLIVSWVLAGICGAYYGVLNSLLASRKQTLKAFFSAIPSGATPLFLSQLALVIIILVPAAIIEAAAPLAGSGAISLAASVVAKLYELVMCFLAVFSLASIISDNSGPFAAIRRSFSLVARNIVPAIAFVLFCLLVSIPALLAFSVPAALSVLNVASGIVGALAVLSFLFVAAYGLFFSFPLMMLANLALYRKLR